ncbi:MAG TPA: PrpF domain-containing protein [Acidimicrobiia bacterium]|nr:PrpF domain-containing protein [Acidimicrobiia bacterium]
MTAPGQNWGSIPTSIMRGGTSRGVVLPLALTPPEGPERDRFLITLMGSNDPGQMDGFGGNTSTTSKVMLVSHDSDSEDIPYLFAQVDPRNPVVDYGGNCGNMTSAVALYAVMEGLTPVTPPMSRFTLANLNTGTRIRAHVPCGPDGPIIEGDYRIAGVGEPGAEIVTEYLDPAGRDGHFPTGSPTDILSVPGVGDVRVSIVDISSPLVFIAARDVGLEGTELPAHIDGDEDLLERLEAIRGTAAVRLGLASHPEEAARRTPGIPKLAMVRPPVDYATSLGATVRADEVDVVARIMSVQRTHHAYAMTGALCTAAATALAGTIPSETVRAKRTGPVRIGHPKGVTSVGIEVTGDGTETRVVSVSVSRTARCLMRGLIEPRIRP